ncbi:MAG: hypothetical protein ACK56F_21250, partial [bacterium]
WWAVGHRGQPLGAWRLARWESPLAGLGAWEARPKMADWARSDAHGHQDLSASMLIRRRTLVCCGVGHLAGARALDQAHTDHQEAHGGR